MPKEKTIKELFVGHCWSYLNDNFHKFTETNKIKIALELCKKDIPQEMKGNFTVTKMPTIQAGTGEAATDLIFDIGTPHVDTTEIPEPPGETPTVN